jgi:asparagine N-glycosylation enzyme membrane subunit Stt3
MMNNKQITTLVFLSLTIAIFVFYVNIRVALGMSQPNSNEMSLGWQQTCTWLRECTFPPSDYYDDKAKPEWGVFSWWDYGYWITREGQRPAITNPGSASRFATAHYLLSDNYSETHDALVKMGVRYIIIDYLMVTNKFYAIGTVANTTIGVPLEYQTNIMGANYAPTKFQQDYMYWDKTQGMPVMLNYEDYYRSLVVRLYNFNGQPIKSPGTPVFQTDKDRNITGIQDFATLDEALAFQKQNGGIIAGSDPFLSPWAMNDNLQGIFKLVYESPNKVKNWMYSECKVFEVTE